MAKVLQYETQKETLDNIKKVGPNRTLLRPPMLLQSSEGGSRMSKRNTHAARTIAQTKTTRNKRVSHQSELPDINAKDRNMPLLTESDESPIY